MILKRLQCLPRRVKVITFALLSTILSILLFGVLIIISLSSPDMTMRAGVAIMVFFGGIAILNWLESLR